MSQPNFIVGSPCEHGGTCVNTPGSFRCDCPIGFTGPRCEININECESNPCQNEGTCIDERGGFRCICMPGKKTISDEAVFWNSDITLYCTHSFLVIYKIFSSFGKGLKSIWIISIHCLLRVCKMDPIYAIYTWKQEQIIYKNFWNASTKVVRAICVLWVMSVCSKCG